MELRDIAMDDLPLYERQLTDPRMMAELGGPLPREGLESKLRGIVADVRAGRAITEVGWMVLPEYQGRGLATRAVAAMLERALAERRWSEIHAFPAVTNGASNAICRKLGFTRLGEIDIDYMGRPLRCSDWVIHLGSAEANESD